MRHRSEETWQNSISSLDLTSQLTHTMLWLRLLSAGFRGDGRIKGEDLGGRRPLLHAVAWDTLPPPDPSPCTSANTIIWQRGTLHVPRVLA